MSQERTRFPIQPKERRRSARSGKTTRRAPEDTPPKHDRRAKGTEDQGKVQVHPSFHYLRGNKPAGQSLLQPLPDPFDNDLPVRAALH
jgi:hypothetical protein